ncbi:RPII140-upstream gene protein isoform X1 [Nomia melanderi]|uniref:RPII140-upstream gene protein isoform X1 n=1 Tax=Nomia melanderi TaxID=2448451 RepID=UPI0013040CC6|nr:RPII140-upstream gene protein isoform X1 [Nomia melanderi]
MLRFKMNRGVLVAFVLPFTSYNSLDVDRTKKKDDSYPTVEGEDSLMLSGTERLKHMLITSNGELTKESQSIISATTVCGIGSFVIGGLTEALRVPEKFKKENQTTKFLSQIHANKLLNDQIALEFFRKGISYGWRVGLFAFFNQAIGVSLYTYRGKHQIRNYTLAGAISGGLFKLHLGLKGICAAGVIGGLFGTIYGTLSVGMLYLSGTTIDQVYSANLEYKQRRRSKMKDGSIDEETKETIRQYEENRILKEILEIKKEEVANTV